MVPKRTRQIEIKCVVEKSERENAHVPTWRWTGNCKRGSKSIAFYRYNNNSNKIVHVHRSHSTFHSFRSFYSHFPSLLLIANFAFFFKFFFPVRWIQRERKWENLFSRCAIVDDEINEAQIQKLDGKGAQNRIFRSQQRRFDSRKII